LVVDIAQLADVVTVHFSGVVQSRYLNMH